MATLAQISGAIKTKLAAVVGVGKVHDYERFAARKKDFQDPGARHDRRRGGAGGT